MATATDTSELARDTRTLLGFGSEAPLPDILQVVEEAAGVAVTLLELPARFACAYALRKGQGFIFVNAHLHLDEQRFALAHAYGHHVLKHRDVLDAFEDVFGNAQAPAEIKANEFAAEFLVPGPAVRRSLRGWRLAGTEEATQAQTVFRLAKYFGVSPALASAQIATAGSKPSSLPKQPRSTGGQVTNDKAVWTPYAARHDSLAEAQHVVPRLPASLQEATIGSYTRGELTLTELANALQRKPNEVDAWLAHNGIARPRQAP